MAYGRHVLPAFDAHVYVAMAERPAFFTVGPWGYRVLTPAAVRLLPFRDVTRRFRFVTEGALVLAGVALFLYLRRLGGGDAAAVLGTAAFVLSSPVYETVHYRFLAEPLTVFLEILFLWALQAGARTPTLALLAVLGTLSKEFFVLLVPLVFLARRGAGPRRALVDTLLVGAPAILSALLLRAWWTPHLVWPPQGPTLEGVSTALERMRSSWPEWRRALLLSGLSVLVLLGAVRREARPLIPPALFLCAVVVFPPFFNPVAFFPSDLPRLLLYALAAAIPLALVALDAIGLRFRPLPPALPSPARSALWLTVAAAALLPLALVDRYRRVDLAGPRDGPYVQTLARESVRLGRRLAQGTAATFDPQSRQFVWGESDPAESMRMRWLLREGWGEHPHYGTGEVAMQASKASLLLPLVAPRDLQVDFHLRAPVPTRLVLLVNGQPVGERRAGPEPDVQTFALPAALLFRGDNLLTLWSVEGQPGIRLLQTVFRP